MDLPEREKTMIIRILPELRSEEQWRAFSRRELPYCFVRSPECLVDFQTTFLVITLLDREVRNGKEAIKYSLGARYSADPAWRFIRSCRYELQYMVDALDSLEFTGSVRDNPFLSDTELTIRKFFAKDRAVISPSLLGPLTPITALPARWTIRAVCRLLANQQHEELRWEPLALTADGDISSTSAAAPDAAKVLLELIEDPRHWRVEVRDRRLYLLHHNEPRFSLRPHPGEQRTPPRS